jgi:hypothetical protein
MGVNFCGRDSEVEGSRHYSLVIFCNVHVQACIAPGTRIVTLLLETDGFQSKTALNHNGPNWSRESNVLLVYWSQVDLR